MMPLVDGKRYSAATLSIEEPTKFAFSSVLLFASLAILLPLASAQQVGYNSANPSFDSIGSGQHRRDYYGLVEFRQDNLDVRASDRDRDSAGSNACPPNGGVGEQNSDCRQDAPVTIGNTPAEPSAKQSSAKRIPRSKPADFNRVIYYKNKLEFALDVGWLPINIPFPFDVFEGDPYDLYPLRYTLVPIVASLRWQIDDV